jgi:hypothetical protein
VPGKAVHLGPFKNGLIATSDSDPTTIPDASLSRCVNFDFNQDGALASRPAIVAEADPPVAGESIAPLGYYVRSDGATFLVATCDGATYIYDIVAKTWTQIWALLAADFVQYDNKIVLISESAAGGYWEAGVFTATTTMPQASQIVFYQERFWAFGPKGTAAATTIYFSKLTVISPPSTIFDWAPTTDFFTVSKGDGQWITGLIADPNALIIFRNSSTWVFTYPTSPAVGTLRQVDTRIGTDNSFTYVQNEGTYYVQSQGFLYQFINFRFYALNTKRLEFVPGTFTAGAAAFELRLSVFGNRIILFYRGALWVYSTVTNTWSEWDSLTDAGYFLTIPPTSLTGDARIALGVTGSDAAGQQKLLRISEDPIPAGQAGEQITAWIRTKATALDEAARFKRMLYWTVEALTSKGLKGTANPVTVISTFVTWDQMEGINQDTFGNWDNPLVILPIIVDDVPYPTNAPAHTVTRLIKDMRFARAYFEVYLQFDGTTRTVPAKIYDVVAYFKVKADVAKKVN